MSEQVEKKPRKIKWWMWVVAPFVLLFLIGAIGAAFGLGQDKDDAPHSTPTSSAPTPTPTSSATESEKPVASTPTEPPAEEPKPTVEPKPTAIPGPDTEPEPEMSLAATVWDRVQANFPGGMSTESPLYAVTEVEDISSGTIRVYVQENLTDDGRALVARHMITLGALDDDELQTVVVRDASGIDSNHFRRNMF